MCGGKFARRITLTSNGECDEIKALSVVAEHLERLRADRSGRTDQGDTLTFH